MHVQLCKLYCCHTKKPNETKTFLCVCVCFFVFPRATLIDVLDFIAAGVKWSEWWLSNGASP